MRRQTSDNFNYYVSFNSNTTTPGVQFRGNGSWAVHESRYDTDRDTSTSVRIIVTITITITLTEVLAYLSVT